MLLLYNEFFLKMLCYNNKNNYNKNILIYNATETKEIFVINVVHLEHVQ